MCLSCGCGKPNEGHGKKGHITWADLKEAAQLAGISMEQAAKNILWGYLDSSSVPDAVEKEDLLSWQLLKARSEHRYTLGLAYPAYRLDVGQAADGHRDFVGAEPLEKAAWSWMKEHRELNLFHEAGTVGHGEVVESYIYRGPDWKVRSPVDNQYYVIKSGDWLVGAVWDPYAWTLIKLGLVNGWSPEGKAQRRKPTPESVANLRRTHERG